MDTGSFHSKNLSFYDLVDRDNIMLADGPNELILKIGIDDSAFEGTYGFIIQYSFSVGTANAESTEVELRFLIAS